MLFLLLSSLFFIIIFFNLISIKFLKVFKILSFFFSFCIFLLVFHIVYNINLISNNFQFFFFSNWIPILNISFILGVDGISGSFILLTAFLVPLCILYSWNQFSYTFKELVLLLFIIEFLLLAFFLVLDLVFFFIFFESVLIPMFLLIGCFGSRKRRIHATFQFFLFTMFGSFFMLISFLLIYFHEGSTDFQIFYEAVFSYELELMLWFCLFFSLAVKIPLFPVHIWLPEAHVEAPTVGSVILAGVLLKMGSYGMLRFLIPTFYFSTYFFAPLIFILSFLSIYYISLITFSQIDLKKLIAYSSVSHMGFVTVSLFTYNIQGIEGSLFLMLSHGIVSSLLFFLIGMLYDRYKTRILFFYSSLNSFMPIFCFSFFIATLANVGFPGTSSFIGEFLIMLSFFNFNKIAFIFNSLSFFVTAVYGFWLYNRISFGSVLLEYRFSDLTKREFSVIFPFLFLIFFFGIFPNLCLNLFELQLYNYIILTVK
jgi:proton-translocating NADH-quinone oxidoreductase chain M